MERTTATSLPSEDLMSGTDTGSNLFDMDVDQALHEFGIGSTSLHATELDPSGGAQPGEDVPMSSESDGGGDGASVEQPDGPPSAESSDSDVIHIDLTQRPPPLPMSSLALEQIVSMLPGSTYAVSGSGIPMRTSPRPEPHQPSPTARASCSPSAAPDAKRASAPGVAASGDAHSSRRPAGSPDAQGTTEPQPSKTEEGPEGSAAQHSSSGTAGSAAAGAGGSPRMALTFIPGLGLVPVVIHDLMEDDEEEDGVLEEEAYDMEGLGGEGARTGGPGLGVVIEEHRSNDGADVAASPLAIDPISDDDDSGIHDGDDARAQAVAAAFKLGDSSSGYDEDFEQDVQPLPTGGSDGEGGSPPDAADGAGGGAGAEWCGAQPETPGTGGASAAAARSPYDISEEQLRDIIQQAVHGLAFGQDDLDEVFEEDMLDEDDGGVDAQAGLSEGSEGALGSPTGRDAAFGAAAGLGGGGGVGHLSIEALYGNPQQAEADGDGAAAAGQVEDTYDDDDFEDTGADTADDDADQGGEEGEEVAEEGDNEEVGEGDCEDEVDDSGSGGAEEPDSILGGLRRPRLGCASENTAPAATHPEPRQVLDLALARASAAVAPATGPGPSGGATPGSRAPAGAADRDDAQAAAAAHRQQPSGGATAGPALPRPRYISNFMAAYEGPLYEVPTNILTGGYRASAQPTTEAGAAPAARAPEGHGFERTGPAAAAAGTDVNVSAGGATASGPPTAAAAPRGAAVKGPSSHSLGASLPTPFAGGVLGGDTAGGGGVRAGASGGSNLNSTMRTSGQSLSAIRLAALREEAQRQAKAMAERLGGGGDDGAKPAADNAPAGAPTHHVGISSHAPGPVSRSGAAHILSPFGSAGHEASAAAGLTQLRSDPDSSNNLNRSIRRGGAVGGGSSSSHAGLEGDGHPWPQPVGSEEEEDVGDIMRDRSIIQPRYPTDAKADQRQHDHHHHHRHHHHHDHGHDQATQPVSRDVSGGPLAPREVDDSGCNGRPRHRRSFELVDLDKIASDADAAQLAASSPTGSSGSSNGSGGGSSPRSPPARSLLATRKSDDGILPQPMPSSSPRMDDDDDRGSASSSSSSSSAHSVADEKLVDELEALREELGQKTTLVAGLRGELRKYTELAVRLEHQLGALRSQAQAQVQLQVEEDGPESTKARSRCQSETGTVGRLDGAAPAAPAPAPAAPPTPGPEQHAEQQPLGGSSALAPPPPTAPGSRLVGGTPAAVATSVQAPAPEPGVNGAAHHLPPHPQAQGLDGAARLALYEEILSQAQLQVARCGGPAPPDLRDVQELLAGKDKDRLELDAGSEKVMLIKVRKMVTWGCEAAWKATVAQQQARHAEQAAQQARRAWEAEREQLRQALEAARAGALFDATGPTRASAKAAGTDGEGGKDLRQQLAAAQVQLAAAQEQVSDLDSVVASLNADVRKLRSQLRSSRDGSQPHPPEPASPSPADSMAWKMERQLLLSRITALEQQLDEARVTDEAAEAAGADARPAPTNVALDRVRQLEEERDEAPAANAELRQQLRDLQEALATAAAAAAGGSPQGLGPAVDVEQQRRELEQLQRELEAARQALQRRTADAQAEHEEQCGVLRAQVVELRRELAASAADAADAIGQLEEEKRVLQAAGADATAQEALARRLQEELLAAEAEVESLRAELSKQVDAREELEAQVQRLRADGLADKEGKGTAVQGKEPGVWERIKVLSAEEDAAATIDALSQALKSEARERGRLQQLLDSTTRELAQAESQLLQVRAATSQLQAEASQTQAQVAQLQTVLAQAQRERDDAAAAAARAKAEVEELRTALGAEDKVQVQLRGQVACMEGELEAQVPGAQQVPSQRALEVGEQAVAAGSAAAEAAEALVAMTRAEAQASKQRAAEAEARVAEAQRCLADALQRGEQAAQQGAELQRRLAEEAGQRQRAERALQEARDELAELRRWHQGSASRESAVATWLAALEERLRDADLDREALQREASELLAQLVASTPRSGAAAPPRSQRSGTSSAGGGSGGNDAASAVQPTTSPPTKAVLVADLARLQSELERLRSAAVEAGSRGSSLGGAPEAGVGAGRPVGAAATPPSLSGGGAKDAVRDGAAAKRAEALEEQLRAARVEAQSLRAELQGARVELAVKAELLTAKDRSLSTLQETVDALKVALQVTQQNLQATPTLSPRDSAQSGGAEPDELKYRGSVAELQSKFEDSESTIRLLQRQVAALETRFVSDGGRPATGDSQQPSTDAAAVVAELRLQLKEREEENGRLRRDVEQLRSLAQAQAPRSPGAGGANDAGAGSVSAATVNELQMQVLQWRALSEDVHARYQSKKETVRRLREQLASEQQRHVDEQARGQAQLEAARQRLARLATELGTALRRCIAMDLQPLSATTLTTSPRSQLGGGDVPDDITALAALLARQGTALVESLETALDQVTSAREERSLLLAQLAHRQAVLDELRHHLVRQAAPSPSAADAAGGASSSSPGGWAGSGLQHRSSYSPTKPGETRTALLAASSVPAGGLHTTTAVTPAVSPPAVPAAAVEPVAAAAVAASKAAAPTLSPSKSLQAAALNLAQDMAALSVQQAGLRSTLHQFEQRQAQQQQQQQQLGTRPRSLSAVPFGPGTAAYPATTALSTYASLGQPGLRTAPRSGSAGSGTDGLLSYGSVSTGAAVPHSFVGILSGGRAAEAGSSGGGGLHASTRPLTGLYQQQQAASSAPGSTVAAPSYDGGRLQDSAAPSSIPTYARGAGASVLGIGTSATITTTGVGAATVAGPSSSLGLSHERRLKLAEGHGSGVL